MSASDPLRPPTRNAAPAGEAAHRGEGEMSWRMPTRPTKRQNTAMRAFCELGMENATPMPAPSAPRGPQEEGLTNQAIAQWLNYHPELMLGRNKRRLAVPVGYDKAIMLGWMVDGSADWIGYRSILITPAMVGRKLAQFVAIEAKRASGGTPSEAQKVFLRAVIDAGGVAGIARNADDAEGLLRG